MADNAEAEQHAILNYPGGELELDIVKASEGAVEGPGHGLRQLLRWDRSA